MRLETLKVIFRTDRDGDTFALFPTEPGGVGKPWECTCYDLRGAHGSAHLRGCIDRSRPATPEEYGPLLKNLRRIYEDPEDPERVKLLVMKRATRGDYENRKRLLRECG